ncbi:hypothetical protein ACLOJK_018771 [Asimina triloba]
MLLARCAKEMTCAMRWDSAAVPIIASRCLLETPLLSFEDVVGRCLLESLRPCRGM